MNNNHITKPKLLNERLIIAEPGLTQQSFDYVEVNNIIFVLSLKMFLIAKLLYNS